jgi:FkbM family methyltransferase
MLRNLVPPIFRSDSQLLAQALMALPEITYRRLRDHGFSPRMIVDVGAWRGNWSESVAQIFPNAKVRMFDALEANREYLKRFKDERFSFDICVLASVGGKQRDFAVSGTGSSLYAERSNAPHSIVKVRTKTLDDVLANELVEDPIFLKLDVQGAELDVLAGGQHTLNRCEVVQLEVGLLRYNDGAPDFVDVVTYMNDRRFKMHEIAGFIRPNSDYLVQIDAIFVREDSDLRPTFFTF